MTGRLMTRRCGVGPIQELMTEDATIRSEGVAVRSVGFSPVFAFTEFHFSVINFPVILLNRPIIKWRKNDVFIAISHRL